MSPVLVAAVWVLVTIDCAFMGYRLAMGRTAVIDKVAYHRRAALRAALVGQVPLAVVVAVAVALAVGGGGGTARSLDGAKVRLVTVGGTYAAVILGTWALCVIPSVTVRTAANVVVFGPLTFLRPVIVAVTVAAAVGPDPSVALVAVGALVIVPGVAVEPVLERRIAQGLVTPRAAPGRSATRPG